MFLIKVQSVAHWERQPEKFLLHEWRPTARSRWWERLGCTYQLRPPLELLYWEGSIQGKISHRMDNQKSHLPEQICVLNVYRTLLRPHIEYAVQIWNPKASHGYWKLILEREEIQRSFTRLTNRIALLPYSERLRILQLTTLLERQWEVISLRRST